MVSHRKGAKLYDQTRIIYEPHPSVYRNRSYQGHDRYPPLWKVGHAGTDQTGTLESGVSPEQFISINFEDMSYSRLQTAQALHDEITKRAAAMEGKVYLFFDEIQEVKDWEKCINSFRISLDCDIYITGSNAKLLSGELATYLGGRYVEFVIYPFSFGEFMELYRSISPSESSQQCFQNTCLPAACLTLRTSATQMLHPSNIFMIYSTPSSSRIS